MLKYRKYCDCCTCLLFYGPRSRYTAVTIGSESSKWLLQSCNNDLSHAERLALCCPGTACEGLLLSCYLCKAQYFVKSVDVCLQAGSNEVSALMCTPV